MGSITVARSSSFTNGHKFSVEEEVVYDLLSNQMDEDLILQNLSKMPVNELKEFTNKEDHKGRTLLVNAIRGNYERVIKLLLVNHFGL